MTAFIVGYDPGGNGKHGVVVLPVHQDGDCWQASSLKAVNAHTLMDVVGGLEAECRGGRIVAAGVDTLTEWNTGPGGWRPADRWLKRTYPAVGPKVVAPAALFGSMAVNGAAFLTLLGPRFRADGTMVTEAHPKVCYYATTGRKPSWSTDREEMTAWLIGELKVGSPDQICIDKDDRFDAGLSALAALRGLNREWTLDLHALPSDGQGSPVRFCGRTHYWWPDPPVL